MKKHIVFFIAVILSLATAQSYGQGVNCLGATPICSNVTTTFPGTIGGTVPAGNNYGCLVTQINPSWFTFTVGSVGAITINQTAPCDQDYAVWGPFNTLSAACAGLTAAPVSCSFSPASGNVFTLPTAAPGQIFIMLLSNFGGCTGNITITESVGGGTLTCVPVCAVTASNLGPYCTGTTITLNATAATGATGYTWTGPNGFTATTQNVTIPNCTAAMAGVYTVTATGAATCTGSTTVVVNPTPTMNPTTNSPVCVGSPLTLCSGAPAGALVAWTGPGYAALSPCPTIASATAAMTGNYTVTVLLNGCQAQQILPVVVSPGPTVTAITPISLCSGGTVPATTFTGTPATATFTWTNNQTSIGLAASGNGGLPSFTATNSTANSVTATISVVPHLGSCNGTASNFTITVSPAPTITVPSSNVYCEGATVPAIAWTTSSGTAAVSWTNNNTATGMGASGTGTIPTFTASQVTSQTISTITATPSQGNCIGTPVTFNLTVNNAPSATITDIGPLCSNVGFQTLVAATPGGVWSGTGIINTSSGLFNPLTAGAATHTITYTLNLPNQCPASDVTQIQVINVPIANAGVNQNVCQGQTVNLNGSFTNSNTGNETFAWTPTTNLTNTTTLTPAYTANSTQTYILTVTSGICSSTDNVVVTVLPQSNATINNAGPYCADVAPVVLTAAQTGGTWSGPGITNASTGAFNPALANVGNNTITYSIGGSCPSTDTQVIVIYAVPSGAITPSGPYCQSALPVTLTAATAGGTWSGTGINNAATGSFGSTTLAANTYAITYTTSGNCPRTFNQNIVVNASTNATINAAGPYCADVAPVVLTAAQTGGTWSGPGITSAVTGAFNPALANVGNNTITYSIGGSCPSTDTQVIVIYAVPSGAITPSGPYCQSALPVTLTAATAGGTWSGTGINNASTGSFGSTTLAASTYAITYTTSGNCPRTFNQNIVVNANTNATIAAAGPFCADVAPVVLTAAQTGGTWSGPGITSAVTGAFNPASANVGPNTITYSIGGSCPSTDTQLITIYAVPSGAITPSGPYCQSALPVTLTAATAGGTWSGTGINNASTGSFGSTTLAASTYAITYTTSGNCPRTFNQNIVVNANTNATITAAGPFCSDDPAVILNAAQTGGTWSGPGITSGVTGAFNPANANTGNNTVTYAIGGPCPSSDTQVIVVNSLPDGTITPAGPFCQSNLPFTLTAASAGGTWSGTGITNTTTGVFGSTTLAANTYTVTYNTGGNCPQIFTENIVVNANTNATITAAGPFCSDDPAVVLVAAQTGGTWSGTGITSAVTGAFNPANANTGNNTVTYAIGGPCPSSDTQVIVVNSLPDGTITPAGPFCQSNLPFTLTAASAGGTWSGTGITNTTTGVFGSTTLAANTYTVTYNTGGNCPQIFTENIVVNANTNATIAAAGPLCADVAPVVLTAAQTGGTWSGPGITSAVTGAFNPALANVGNNTITYSIGGPCPSTDTQTVLIYDVPDGTINPAGPYCQSALPVTLTSATPGGTWSGTGINNAATGSFGSTTLAANTYAVTYTTSGNCPRTFNQNIVVNATTNATITAAGPFCSDDPAVILNAAQTGGTWSGTGITSGVTGAFNPATANTGDNTITYAIGGPCPSTDTQVIVVNSLPDGTITPAGPFCQSSLPFTLTAASAGGTWSGTGITNTTTGVFGSTTLAANTYTVTYNTGGNCPQIFTENIVVNANTNATISAAGPYCADVAPLVLTAAQTGGVWTGSGITDAATGAFSPAIAIVGDNLLTYTIGGPCPSSDTQTIVIYPVLDGTITPAGPFCQSDLPVTLTAASTGGTWSGTGINNASAGAFGSSTLAANTYTITYNTGGNCPLDFTETIIVNANVDATITPQANLCADAASIIFVGAELGGIWGGNGITDTATGAFDPASVIPGIQTITYTISGTCPDTDTQTIEVYPVYDGTITPAGPFCQSDLPVLLTAASAGGTWSGSGFNNVVNGSFGSTNLAGNTYTVTYTTAGNCPRVFNETVVVNANVDATISNVLPLCADVAPFNLTAADAGGTWSGTGITDAVAGTFDPSIATANQTITYTIPGSCPSTDTQDITVYAVYDGTITPAGPFCQSDLPVTLTAASTGGTWSGTGISSASAGTFGSNSLAANSYTITYTTQGNCSQANTTTIVVNESVDATVSAVADVCNDAPAFNMTAADAGGTWSGQGVSATGTFTPNSVTPNTYTITYSIGGACPDSDTQDIVVLVVPDGTITPAGPFCQDALPQTLVAASSGGVWSGTGINNAATGAFGAANTPAGNYSITYTTPGACSNSFNQVVQVIANLDATIGAAGPFCEDAAPFNLSAASAGGVWSGTGAITAGGQINPGVLDVGTYTFNYNIDNNGCLSSDNVQVTVNALPQPSFTASVTEGCSPLSVTFTNTSNPLGSNCVWYVDGVPAGNGNSYSEIFTGSSCSDIGIMVTDALGCSQNITMTDLVCAYPNPSASFSWSPLEPLLGETVSFENTSIGGLTYDWDINGQGASGESVTFDVLTVIDGEFQACLQVEGQGGCMDSQCYTIVLSSESYIFVPNSFTPDADGTNDVFAPVIAGLTSDYSYTFRIYDRWGEVVFETNDPNDVWTGNVHGRNHYAQPDAYVYEITLQLRAGEVPIRKVGSVVLIR